MAESQITLYTSSEGELSREASVSKMETVQDEGGGEFHFGTYHSPLSPGRPYSVREDLRESENFEKRLRERRTP